MSPRVPIDQAAVARFCERGGIRRLAFFGSVLRDDFGPESDVDVRVAFGLARRVGFIALARFDRDRGALLGRRVNRRTARDLSRYLR